MTTTPRALRDALAAVAEPERLDWLTAHLRAAARTEQGPGKTVLSLAVSHPALLRAACARLAEAQDTRGYALAALARLHNRREEHADLSAVLTWALGQPGATPELGREALRAAMLGRDAVLWNHAWPVAAPGMTPLGVRAYGMQRALAWGETAELETFNAHLACRMAALDRTAWPAVLRRLETASEVALVGNGGSLTGTGAGEAIDAHEVVVRLNYPLLSGFGADAGARTDVMLFGESKRPFLAELFEREQGYGSLPALGLKARMPARAEFSPPALPRAPSLLVDEIGYRGPTTGFIAILLIALLLRRPVTLFGFDFFRPGLPGHYFGGSTAALGHELAYERWMATEVVPRLCPALRRVAA